MVVRHTLKQKLTIKEKDYCNKNFQPRGMCRVMRNVLVLILTLAVISLVIIGLINFDLLLTLTGKLIAAIVIIGLLVIPIRLLFFCRR